MVAKKIISFDVGIKHLAYCVLTTTAEPDTPEPETPEPETPEPETPQRGGTQHSTPYQIPDWQIINLLDTSEANASKTPTHTCCANAHATTTKKTNANPKICQKKALYQTPITPPSGGRSEETPNYFCKKHAENHPLKIPDKSLLPTKTEIAKMSIEDLRNLIQQIETQNQNQNQPQNQPQIETFFQTQSETQKETAHKTKKACIEKIEQLKATHFFQLIPQTKKQNASHTSMLLLCQSLYNKFNQLATQFENATHVVIENQLGSNATRMMILQGMITMYFTAHLSNPIIAHVSSSHKLKYAVSILSHTHQETQTQKHKTTYKEHKQNAVLYCEQILEMHNQSQTQMFKDLKKNKADEKKRDDLADCFLQGLWYLSTL